MLLHVWYMLSVRCSAAVVHVMPDVERVALVCAHVCAHVTPACACGTCMCMWHLYAHVAPVCAHVMPTVVERVAPAASIWPAAAAVAARVAPATSVPFLPLFSLLLLPGDVLMLLLPGVGVLASM